MIRAEAHSDDYRVEVRFDATEAFRAMTDEEIIALADVDWGGDYEADAVAEHFEQTATRELFDYTAISGEGFECHVNEGDALAWLKVNRSSLYRVIEEGE